MRSLPPTPGRMATVLGLMALAAAAGASVALGAESATPLAITGYTVHHDLIRVGVVNRGVDTRTAIITVRVQGGNGEMMETLVPVTVGGGQKAFVEVGMPSRIEPPAEVSIILDDGSPF